MQLIALDVGDDFVVEADLVQVAAAVIQVVDLSAVGQDGGGTVAVEVVVVADAFGNARQLSFGSVREFGFVTRAVGNPVGLMVFIVVVGGAAAVRIGYRQQQTVSVVVEAGKDLRIGKGMLKIDFRIPY